MKSLLLGSLVFVSACAGARGVQATAPRIVAYVTNEDSGDLSVLDVEREAVTSTIVIGKRPRGIRVSTTRPWVFAAVSGSPKAAPGQEAPAGALVRLLESGPDPESFDLSGDEGQL